MCKRRYLLILLFFIVANVNGQRRLINGFLKDSITLFPIAAGTVTNGTTSQKVLTDEKGFFRLEAAPNDFIYAFASSYHYDTLSYSFLFTDTITIFLSPAGNILPNVLVTVRHTKYQLDSMERKATFEKLRGTSLSAISSAPSAGFGVTVNLDRFFKKKYRDKQREERIFSKAEKMAYVNYRYSPRLVNFYTGLKGDALRSFMNRFTPDYNWLRSHPTNEDVMYYINDKLKVAASNK